ncbi:Oidioi.mRNA.OKI2018_I69.XSR.g15885.t2.cds [Oikopleura dioica]|uniref:Oidioi.mRNA.OKI2018_I69.XSR.g15885.t2.cds n=1 Tax=Oikopleura dioica TaxID=34765 RepID=A0ABN7SKN5_OIKDI|nr:Oidioi.mRNA.OKI2018_I69.XSR.g15885.t2.cds [Oikopleura dioica]
MYSRINTDADKQKRFVATSDRKPESGNYHPLVGRITTLRKVAADPSPKCSPCESPVISTPSTIGSIRRSITPDYSSRSSSRSSFSSRGSSYSRRSSYSRDRSYSSRSSRSRSYSVYFLLQRQL